ncbi:restriction endonuclease subunit S [Kitasatospora sp. NPDC088351]|uniref:restriction endonuclease subunit S n=1 Tax=Kitasatospora sp. NPDC088351 TaxID=3155180 RepID=UPI003418978F
MYPLRPLGDVLSLAPQMVPLSPDSHYPVTGIYSFGKGLIKRSPILGSDTAYERMAKLRVGQLVISKLNAWEGALAVVTEDFGDTYVSPEYPVFSISASADSNYIKHLVAWPALWEFLTPRGSMVRRKRTNPDTFLATMVPLPDLAEQRRLAAKLDAAISRLTRIESLRTRMSDLQSSLFESMVHAAQEAATTTVRVGEVLTLTREPIEVDPGAHYRAIGMRSFGKGMIHYPSAPSSELSKLRYFNFPADALALSNIKAWEGAISVTSIEDATHIASNRFLFYRPLDKRVNVSYLRHYFLSKQGLAQISACSPGAADRNRTLGVKRFENIEFALPPREEQDRVASTLDDLADRIRKVHGTPSLGAIRPALLNAAFAGRL